MKSNNRWFIVLTVIIRGLVGCNIYLVVQNKNIHTNKEDNASILKDIHDSFKLSNDIVKINPIIYEVIK